MREICCNCKHLRSYIEPISPSEGAIKHTCAIDKKDVEYNSNCHNGKFDIKNEYEVCKFFYRKQVYGEVDDAIKIDKMKNAMRNQCESLGLKPEDMCLKYTAILDAHEKQLAEIAYKELINEFKRKED